MSADEFANPMVVIGVEIAQSPGSSVAEMIELNEVAISDDELADLTDAVSDGEDEVGEEYVYGFPKRTEEEAFEFEDARGRQVAALHGTLAALAQGVMGMRGSVEELSAKVAQMHG